MSLKSRPAKLAYQRKYYKRNREHIIATVKARALKFPQKVKAGHRLAARRYREKYRFTKMAKLYGLTLEEARLIDAITECMICGREAQAVDHDHATGIVRGRLCHTCNQGLGLFKDSPELLRFAAMYLEASCV